MTDSWRLAIIETDKLLSALDRVRAARGRAWLRAEQRIGVAKGRLKNNFGILIALTLPLPEGEVFVDEVIFESSPRKGPV